MPDLKDSVISHNIAGLKLIYLSFTVSIYSTVTIFITVHNLMVQVFISYAMHAQALISTE